MKIDRRTYADHYGPTTGDRIRLADTDLIIRIERDLDHLRRRGEVRRRQGDPRRHGAVADGDARRRRARSRHHLGRRSSTAPASTRPTSASATAGSRRSARPAIPASWTASRRAWRSARRPKSSPARGSILTAGGIDSHVHFISPNQIPDAFHSGITTLIGGGTGPATGTNATTCTPGRLEHPADVRSGRRRFRSTSASSARATRRRAEPLREQIRAGAIGLEAARGLGHDAGGDRSAAWRSPTSSTCRWRSTPTR